MNINPKVQSVVGSLQTAAQGISQNEEAAMAQETRDTPTFAEQQAQIAASAERNEPITPAFTPFVPASGHRAPFSLDPDVANELG